MSTFFARSAADMKANEQAQVDGRQEVSVRYFAKSDGSVILYYAMLSRPPTLLLLFHAYANEGARVSQYK